MSYFFIECPYCHGQIKKHIKYIGHEFSCPHCQRGLKLEINGKDNTDEDSELDENIIFCSYCQKAISIEDEICPHCNKQTPLGIKNNGMENKKDNCPLCQKIIEIPSNTKRNTIILCPYCSSEIYYTSNCFLRKVTASDKKIQKKQEKEAQKSPLQKNIESNLSAIFWLFILLAIPFCLIYGSYLVWQKENFSGLFYVGIPILIFSLCMTFANIKNKNSFFSYIKAFFSSIIITPLFSGIIILILGILISFACSRSNYNSEKWDVLDMAERHLKNNYLKAPSTAKFKHIPEDSISDAVKKIGPNRYRVTSYVDAQNSFGAMIRTNFTIEIYKKRGSWYAENLITY